MTVLTAETIESLRHQPLPDTLAHRWSVRRPLLTAGLSVAAATALGLWLPTVWVWVLAGALMAGLLIPPLRRQAAVIIILAAAVTLVNCGCYRYTRQQPAIAANGRQDTLTGQVVSLPATGRMFTVEVTDSTVLPTGTRVALYSPETAPCVGDLVTADVELSVPYFTSSRRVEGVFLYAFPVNTDEDHVVISDGDVSALIRLTDALRSRLKETLNRGVGGEERAMLAALCLGEKAAVSAETRAAFNGSGLAHLLVVSGLHLSLLTLALHGGLRQIGLGYRLSAAVTLLVLPLFVLLVGGGPSVLRAAIMCGVWLCGLMLERRADALNSLGLALAILLIGNPYYLFSAGFQLSFAATAGVVCIAPRLCRHLPRYDPDAGWLSEMWRQIRNFIHTASAVCVGATLFTLPIACYYYGGFSLTFIPANLLAVTPAGWALVLGWLGMLCCLTPLTAWLGQPLLTAAGYLARYLRFVAGLCSPEGSFLHLPRLWGWLLITALCLLIICYVRYPIHRLRFAATVMAFVLLAVGVATPVTHRLTEMTVTRTSTGAVLTIHQRGRMAVVSTDSSGLLTASGETTPPTAVFIGKGDPNHAARAYDVLLGGARVYTADPLWTLGCPEQPAPMAVGDTVTLWDGAQITVYDGELYRVEVGAETVWLCGDAAVMPPTNEGVAVVAGIPKAPTAGYTVVTTSTARLRRHQPHFADNTLVLTETNESVIFIAPTGGEWSVWPWQ